MAYEATTIIRHGVGGTEHIFQPGETLPEDLFSAQHLADLASVGAVKGFASETSDEDGDEDGDEDEDAEGEGEDAEGEGEDEDGEGV